MKTLALLIGILGDGWGSAPILLTPSVWLGCYWWGVVGLDSASKGTMLIFRIIVDFGGIVCKGICVLSLFVSQLPSEVANLMWWAFFAMLDWAASCDIWPKCSE